jgi:potassium/hydrogen antiporter
MIGFLANYIFKKTGFPDMLVLIFVGMLFGPILGVFDSSAIGSFTPLIAALALSYTIFDGGLGLNIGQVVKCSPIAILLAVLGFLFSVVAVGAFMMLVFEVSLLYGLLFGVIFGGSSAVVVVSLVAKIKISDRSSTILILESAITDIFTIVIAVALIEILLTGATNVGIIGFNVAAKFLVGLVMGLALGIAWLFILRKAASLPFSYMLTLAAVLLGYAGAEAIGGSGVLCVLLFGLILGNEKEIFKLFRRKLNYNSDNGKTCISVSRGLLRFNDEIAFLIGTFFFVFLGMIASMPSLPIIVSGIVLSVIMLIVRYGAVWLTTFKTSLKRDRGMLTVILTRGLATAVLATFPAQYGLLYSDFFIDISIVVVMITAIMATVGSILISRKKIVKHNGDTA